MCINKQDSEKFWIKQVFQNASITQPTEYARMCLDRYYIYLNIYHGIHSARSL